MSVVIVSWFTNECSEDAIKLLLNANNVPQKFVQVNTMIKHPTESRINRHGFAYGTRHAWQIRNISNLNSRNNHNTYYHRLWCWKCGCGCNNFTKLISTLWIISQSVNQIIVVLYSWSAIHFRNCVSISMNAQKRRSEMIINNQIL